MSNQTLALNPSVTINNGKVTTTSLAIAEHFGKEHKNVIRAIKSLECSEEFNRLNFAPVEYTDAKGEKRPMYEITRDGFSFLVMGFTGKEAAQWKEAYINLFNRLELELLGLNRPALPPINTEQQLLLCQIAENKVKTIPAEVRRKANNHIWRKFHTRFKVASYKDLPANKLGEAKQYLEAFVFEGEWISGYNQRADAKYHYPLDSIQGNTAQKDFWMTVEQILSRKADSPIKKLLEQHKQAGENIEGAELQLDILLFVAEQAQIANKAAYQSIGALKKLTSHIEAAMRHGYRVS